MFFVLVDSVGEKIVVFTTQRLANTSPCGGLVLPRPKYFDSFVCYVLKDDLFGLKLDIQLLIEFSMIFNIVAKEEHSFCNKHGYSFIVKVLYSNTFWQMYLGLLLLYLYSSYCLEEIIIANNLECFVLII